jgi:hypothetical protein
MEEDIPYSSSSKIKEKVLHRLQEAIEAAQERAAYESAHNEDFVKALGIVASFLKRKKRVCYGGTAMNSILPKERQFYNPDFDLPDYDFYTPDLEGDVEELVAELKAAGFQDVYHRVGIHEGTKKILVNFVAVADISFIQPELFAVLYKRSIQRNGVHYTDPDVLRMMMYLELSRPRGQVERWEKVFERLQLINREFPVEAPKGVRGSAEGAPIPFEARRVILDYAIEKQRILCNGPLPLLYGRGIHRGDAKFSIRPGGPVFLITDDPHGDALALKGMLETHREIRLFLHKVRGELVPERIELRIGSRPICLLMKEVACHSYHTIPLEDGRMISIGSLELLITIYLALTIFTNHSEEILGPNALGAVRQFVTLAEANYKANRSQFSPFPLSCHGHQTGYASLIRQKVLRIQREKKKAARKYKSKTLRSKQSARSKATRKSR